MAGFGSLEFYSGGFELPEGLYATDYLVKMHQATKQDGTPASKPRLCVVVSFTPIDEEGNPTGDPIEKPISMGTKAHESWAPDPDTGKGISPISGGKGQAPSNQSNWFLYMKSAMDCGAPGFDNDISVWDGMWVRTQNVPEPESRKDMKNKTGEEGEEQQNRGSGKVSIVCEIPDAGKPWEGTGGIKSAGKGKTPAAAAKAAPKAAAPKAAAAAPKAPAKVAAPAVQNEENKDVAESALTDILGELPSDGSITKLKLKTDTFKAIKSKQGEETAQAVITEFFGTDDALNAILDGLGFVVDGNKVVSK